MRAAKLSVVIPENHRLELSLPEDLPSGPAELIVLVMPTQNDVRLAEEQADVPGLDLIGFLSDDPDLADEIHRIATSEREHEDLRDFDDEKSAP